MGRPLFSSLYRNDVPVASLPLDPPAPEPQPEPYQKWSPENPFNPDSDEFFAEAVFEAFIDERQEPEDSEQTQLVIDDADEASSDVSTTDVDQQSPMAVGSDDPTRMLSAYAYISQWEQNYRLPDGDSHSEQHLHQGHNPVDILLRTTDITPIPIPRPMTPPTFAHTTPPTIPTYRSATPPSSSQSHSRHLFTPSPASTTTPRVFGWVNSSTYVPVFPASPPRVGPLSNPDARISLSHISHALPVHNVA